MSLIISRDDCINNVKFSYDNYINNISFKTYRGKTITTTGISDGENKVELYENSSERTMNLLGMIIGHQDKVNCVQFYYDKKYI